MKKHLVIWWGAAGLSLLSAGATFSEVHLQQQIGLRLSQIHDQLAIAKRSTQSMNRQLGLLQRINQKSNGVLSGLNQTLITSGQIETGLAALRGIVQSINGHVAQTTANTNQSALRLQQGVPPTRHLNQILGQVQETNTVVQKSLVQMLQMDRQLNTLLQKTDQKIP